MEIAQAFSLLLANNTLEDGESMLDYFIQLTERNFIQAYHTILICSFPFKVHRTIYSASSGLVIATIEI